MARARVIPKARSGGNGALAKVGYQQVVQAREGRDKAAETVVGAVHARFAAERELANSTEAAVVGLLNASRPLA